MNERSSERMKYVITELNIKLMTVPPDHDTVINKN